MTNNMTEKEKLKARIEKLKSKGLVDIKFSFDISLGVTSEKLCEEVNEMLDKWESGEFVQLNFKDSKLKIVFGENNAK